MSSIPTDFYGDEEEEEDFEDEEAERRAIRKMDEPLPTRPMRKPEVEEQEILPEEDEVFIDDEFEPLPEDDEPLITKPLKEE